MDELAGNVNKTRLSRDRYNDFTKPHVADITDNISIKVKIMPTTDAGSILELIEKMLSAVAYLIKK